MRICLWRYERWLLKNNEAIFNVGGGIVIDSEPEDEYEETLTKAKALLDSIKCYEIITH